MKIKILILSVILGTLTSAMAQDKKKMEETHFDEDWAKINEGKPLFINGNVIKADVGANVAYSCIITPFSPALEPGFSVHSAKENILSGRSIGWISNIPIRLCFQYLYSTSWYWTDPSTNSEFTPTFVPNSRTLFKDIDSTGLVYIVNGKKIFQNLYTIQLTSTGNVSIDKTRKHMISDLEYHFGLKTYWEKHVRKCIVISRNDFPVSEYNGGELSFKMGTLDGKGSVDMNNVPLQQFINFMVIGQFKKCDYPIVDETGLTKNLGKIEFLTKEPGLTFENMKAHLEKHGLKLSIEEREVDMLVIAKADL